MNDRKREVKTVTLAYFSGTGGTKAIVSCFETQFIKSGIHVISMPQKNVPNVVYVQENVQLITLRSMTASQGLDLIACGV